MATAALSLIDEIKNDAQSVESQGFAPVKPVFESAPSNRSFFSNEPSPENDENYPPIEKKDDAPGRVGEGDDYPSGGVVSKSEARLFTLTLDMGISRLSSVWGGQPAAKYKITKEEKQEYEEILLQYMKETGFRPNIHIQFWLATGAIFGAKLIDANDDRQSRKKQSARIRKRIDEGGNVEIQAPKVTTRTRFWTDINGYYERDTNSAYIPQAERVEKPVPELAAIIDRAKKQGHKEGEINRLALEFLGIKNKQS